ncbi:MAG TPA: transglutaminase family protein [Polyangia bacterium]
MNRSIIVVIIGSLLAGACRGGHGRTDSGAATARTLLAAGRDVAPPSSAADRDWAKGELERIASRVRAERQRDPGAGNAAAINRTLFDVLAFSREVDDADLGFVLLPSVLRQRRGSCVGLGALFIAVAALLDVPAAGVVVPGHFFVRVAEGGRSHNVELLRRGEEMPDDWYRSRYPIAGNGAAAYGRLLTVTEVRGVIEYNVGQQAKRLNQLPEARRAYQRATEDFPAFAEAHASLGATLHLLGALDAAATAYAAAARAYPALPGLKDNIDLLESERRVPTNAVH